MENQDQKVIQMIATFMSRANLNAQEIPAYQQCVDYLEALFKEKGNPPAPEEPTKGATKEGPKELPYA